MTKVSAPAFLPLASRCWFVHHGRMMTPPEIEETYHELLKRSFPFDECRVLKKKYAVDIETFAADLQSYWATIAGFASSATHLDRRSQLQLYWGKQTLALSFFERFPQYAGLSDIITEKLMPKLWGQMRLYEEQRKTLLLVLKRICWFYADAPTAPAAPADTSNAPHAA